MNGHSEKIVYDFGWYKQKQAVLEERFWTVGEVVWWYAGVPRIEVSYWFWWWGYWKKVPHPLAERVDIQARGSWKRGAIGSPSAAGGETGV